MAGSQYDGGLWRGGRGEGSRSDLLSVVFVTAEGQVLCYGGSPELR